MTELLNTMMNKQTATNVERVEDSRRENFKKHGIPVIIALAGVIGAGAGVATYDQFGPQTEVARQTEYLQRGSTPIDAAQTAFDSALEKHANLGINRTDVNYAAMNARLGEPVQPQNIDLLVRESPIFHRKTVEVVPAPTVEK